MKSIFVYKASLKEVKRLISIGHFIAAIKEYRALKGTDLKTSLDACTKIKAKMGL